jgi:molecular chaperone HscA
MSLLQITEPGVESIPHQRNIAIGIDLGTTNSLVATVRNGDSVVLADENGYELIPSVVYYGKDKRYIGQEAQPFKVKDSANTLVSTKRFMGKSFTDLDLSRNYPYKFMNNSNSDIVEFETRDGIKNPLQVASDILQYLKEIATQRTGETPSGAVITVPAYFNEAQRQATKQAAQLAGLHVLRLLNEPTAAAIAYGLDTKNQGVFLVFDLGGGTFDVSILRLHNGVFEVIAVNGDTHLGGDDFDHRLYCYILEKMQLKELNNEDVALLLVTVNRLKQELSTKEKVAFHVTLSNRRLVNLAITRDEFNQITATLIKKTLTIVAKALRDANLATSEIDDIILVGGQTRMPAIKEALSAMFNCQVLHTIDPDKVVAIGAAIQADVLAGNRKQDWLLLDVTPLSLGLETMGGIVEKIIPRNCPIPVARAQEFTTYKDGQTAMSLHVVQGERELVVDCRSLARFSLKNIPPMPAGQARIKMVFQIDADGLLSVSATESITGQVSSIAVKPSFGLDETQIADMLKQSVVNAKSDMIKRQLQESIVNANGLIDSIENAINQDGDLLSNVELESINSAITKLRQLIAVAKDTDYQSLDIMSKELNQLTEGFATKRMDRALKTNLTGKAIDDYTSNN